MSDKKGLTLPVMGTVIIVVSILFIWLLGGSTAPIERSIVQKGGTAISLTDYTEFFRKMTVESLEIIARKSAYDLGKTGGMRGSSPSFWSIKHPKINDLRAELEMEINRRLPNTNIQNDIEIEWKDSKMYVYPIWELIGDIDGDGDIDVVDVNICVPAFGSFPGHPNWTPECDLNHDKKIDMHDISLIVRNYGKTRFGSHRFLVIGNKSFSAYSRSINTRIFVNNRIKKEITSYYFELLAVGRKILENETYNSSLSDVVTLESLLNKDFSELNFTIKDFGDYIDVVITANRSMDCISVKDYYCVAPLRPGEGEMMINGKLVPYDYLKLHFRIGKIKKIGVQTNRILFVTSSRYDGDLRSAVTGDPAISTINLDTRRGSFSCSDVGLHGRFYADCICNYVADNAGLSGSWMALINDWQQFTDNTGKIKLVYNRLMGGDPDYNFNDIYPIYNTFGERVADNFTSLFDTVRRPHGVNLTNATRYDESGNNLGHRGVWTGLWDNKTFESLYGHMTCDHWTDDTSPPPSPPPQPNYGWYGISNRTVGWIEYCFANHYSWASACFGGCSATHSIYCLQTIIQTECNDTIDNDDDGLTDLADSDCTGPSDDTECGEAGTACTKNENCCDGLSCVGGFCDGSANMPPVALFTKNATIVNTGGFILFNASSSFDPDGSIVSYSWDFGDGNTGTGVTTSHSWSSPGCYTVTLTVTDDDGATDSTFTIITVTSLPEHNLTVISKIDVFGSVLSDVEVDVDGNIDYTDSSGIVKYNLLPGGHRIEVENQLVGSINSTLFFDGGEDWTHDQNCPANCPWDDCLLADGGGSNIQSVSNAYQSPKVGSYYIAFWDWDNDNGWLKKAVDTSSCDKVYLVFYSSTGSSNDESTDDDCRISASTDDSSYTEIFSSYEEGSWNGDWWDGNWHYKEIDITNYKSSSTYIRLHGRPTYVRSKREWCHWDDLKILCERSMASRQFSHFWDHDCDETNVGYYLDTDSNPYNFNMYDRERNITAYYKVLTQITDLDYDGTDISGKLLDEGNNALITGPKNYHPVCEDSSNINPIDIDKDIVLEYYDGSSWNSIDTITVTSGDGSWSYPWVSDPSAIKIRASYTPSNWFYMNSFSETVIGSMPNSFDWSHQVLPAAPPVGGDWMTPIRNQGGCDSCWAFSTIGSIEGKYNIQENDETLDVNLSEQYLVSNCCNCGDCNGGYHICTFNYLEDPGVPDEACYPYSGTDSPCSDRCGDWSTRMWNVSDYDPTGTDRSMIKYYLVNEGPIFALMMMSTWDPLTYECSSGNSDHGVVIVGYDDTEGVWIVRNSWGTSWPEGINGYFKVKYGYCNIEDDCYYIENVNPP